MRTIFIILITLNFSVEASSLESDDMCQKYVDNLFTNIKQSEAIGMQSLRVVLNRIADNHPEYLDIATQIAFGDALNEEGHRRVGQYINASCTKKGEVLNDILYEVLLSEAKKLVQVKQ